MILVRGLVVRPGRTAVCCLELVVRNRPGDGLTQQLSKAFLVVHICQPDEQLQYLEIDDASAQDNAVCVVAKLLGEN